MEILLVVDDCVSEGEVGEFHWRCRGDEVEEQLIALLNQDLTPTPSTRTLTVYEVFIVGADRLAEFPLVHGDNGFIDLDPAHYDPFLDFCRGLQKRFKD